MVTVRDAVRALERDGWRKVRRAEAIASTGIRRNPGTVTVAGSFDNDLARGTWASIKREAGLID